MSRVNALLRRLPLRDACIVLSLMLIVILIFHFLTEFPMWNQTFGGVTRARSAFVAALAVFMSTWAIFAFAMKRETLVKSATPAQLSERDTLLAGTDDRYVLEMRNVDLMAEEWGGVGMWRTILRLGNPVRSFLDFEDPLKAYPTKGEKASSTSAIAYGLVYETVASQAIPSWPLPTFITLPPHHPDENRPAALIHEGRQRASLGATLFLWQDDEASTSTQGAIERVFAFFDANPDVPSALIVAKDGDWVREIRNRPIAGGLPADPLPKTTITHSSSAVLVTRSDRVDRFVRPFVPKTESGADAKRAHADQDTFWHFYHHMNASHDPETWHASFKASLPPEHRAGKDAPVMSTEFWHSKLPKFWANRKDTAYKPSPFLPVRWAASQLKLFDDAPLVGYLHRPVKVSLRDAQGKALPHAAVVANLRKGYEHAASLLADGKKPSRLFYDGSVHANWKLAVVEALRNLPEGSPNPEREGDSYDIGTRIGNLGAVSALGQVALATMAGHEDGRVGITLNTDDGDHADFIVVTPPDETTRTNNRKRHDSRMLLGGY